MSSIKPGFKIMASSVVIKQSIQNFLRSTELSQPAFMKLLGEKKYENVGTIKSLERLFKERRGYVFKKPTENTPVILLLSGGMDSIVSLGILLEVYKLKVFPLFVNRRGGNIKRSLQSVNWFMAYFGKRYPKLLKELTIYNVDLIPPQLIDFVRKNPLSYYHNQVLFDVIDQKTKEVNDVTLFCFNQLMSYFYFIYGLRLRQHIYEHNYLKISTIYCSILPSDGEVMIPQTFTSLRSAMLTLCTISNDYSIQLSSVLFEKELGLWLNKEKVIKIGAKMGIPLEKTWTCYNYIKNNKYQCGSCINCIVRKEAFLKSGVEDKTAYEDCRLTKKMLAKAKLYQKKLKGKLGQGSL